MKPKINDSRLVLSLLLLYLKTSALHSMDLSVAVSPLLVNQQTQSSEPLTEQESKQPQLSRLLLSTHYQNIDDIENYLVSEKLDGVKGIWDGHRMWTRRGQPILIPPWFTQGFPDFPLEGELWLGRRQFDAISALVRVKSHTQAHIHLWQKVRFMVFEVPEHQGAFNERYQFMATQLLGLSPYLNVISQLSMGSIDELDKELSRVIALGGEGLMLHHKQARVNGSKVTGLIKLKPFYDAEAKVVGYKPGKGRFAGMMGALIVETPQGIRFSLGSGFTLEQRQVPPEIGAQVTYKYYSLTAKGVPRFASFLRVRFPANEVNE